MSAPDVTVQVDGEPRSDALTSAESVPTSVAEALALFTPPAPGVVHDLAPATRSAPAALADPKRGHPGPAPVTGVVSSDAPACHQEGAAQVEEGDGPRTFTRLPCGPCEACGRAREWICSDASDPPARPAEVEIDPSIQATCNGLDDDCDGAVDYVEAPVVHAGPAPAPQAAPEVDDVEACAWTWFHDDAASPATWSELTLVLRQLAHNDDLVIEHETSTGAWRVTQLGAPFMTDRAANAATAFIRAITHIGLPLDQLRHWARWALGREPAPGPIGATSAPPAAPRRPLRRTVRCSRAALRRVVLRDGAPYLAPALVGLGIEYLEHAR